MREIFSAALEKNSVTESFRDKNAQTVSEGLSGRADPDEIERTPDPPAYRAGCSEPTIKVSILFRLFHAFISRSLYVSKLSGCEGLKIDHLPVIKLSSKSFVV
jgi:hypothetical protein